MRTPEVANLLHLCQGWVLSYPLGVYGGKKGGRRPGGASSPGEDLQTPGLWYSCQIRRVSGNLICTSPPGCAGVPDRASSGEGGLPWVEAPPPGGKIPQEPGCVPGTPLPLRRLYPPEEKQKLRRGLVRVYGVLPGVVLLCFSLRVLQHKDTDFSPHFNSKYLLFPEPGWT